MSAPDVVIFVRHSAGCKHAGDDFARRCNCRKHLRWTVNGKRYRRPANTRSWQEAERAKRDIEAQLAGRIPTTEEAGKPIADAVALFIQDKTVQGVSESVVRKYTRELKRLTDFCESAGVFTVQAVSRELLTGYCATWETRYPSSCTRAKVRERCRAFLRYCYECKWLERIPALPKIKIEEVPTMPLADDEYVRLLDALYVVNPRRWDGKQSTRGLSTEMHTRIRCLLQLMRWSGLAIRDALSLTKAALTWDTAHQTYRVTTSRQKTDTHVSILLPPDVSAELKPLAEKHSVYVLFPEAALDFEDLAKTYTNRYIRPAFEAANIGCQTHMVSHRLRDTFAVDLLSKGVGIEAVAKALGDTVKTTEKHYAKWVKSRQDHLDSLVTATWAA